MSAFGQAFATQPGAANPMPARGAGTPYASQRTAGAQQRPMFNSASRPAASQGQGAWQAWSNAPNAAPAQGSQQYLGGQSSQRGSNVWTPSAQDFNPQTGEWRRPQATANPTPWNPATWTPPTGGALTGAEHAAFRAANPVGSPGFNAVANSDYAQRQRSMQAGQYGATPEVYEAMRDYADARGWELTQPGATSVTAGSQALGQLYKNTLANMSNEDAIRELRDAATKMRADNALADQRAESALRNTIDHGTQQWEHGQTFKQMRADADAAQRSGDADRARQLRAEADAFAKQHTVGGLPVINPADQSEEAWNRQREVAVRDNRRTLTAQRNSWGNSLYSDAYLGAMGQR